MTKAAIVGGSVIGGGWAARFLLNGWDVAVFDPDPDAERKLAEVLDNARATLPMLYETRLPEEGHLTFAATLEEAVQGATYIQESVPDNLDLKRRVYARIESANADAPIGSSTAGFKPTDLAQGLSTAHRLIVAHPSNPVYLLPQVELAGPADATRVASKILRSLGMSPLILDDNLDGLGATHLPDALWGGTEDRARTLSPRDFERLRDRNLVALLRALKREGSAVGQVIADHERTLPAPDLTTTPMVTVSRVIPSDWTDYNGHMNESRYGQIWSDAADAVLAHIGAGMEYVEAGNSYFTVETRTNFLLETHAGEAIRCITTVTAGERKKLGLTHEMRRTSDDALLATCDQLLIHVSLQTRKSCPPAPEVLARLETLAAAHRP